MDRTFKGAAKRLDDLDLPKLGALIGVGEDEIHAFLDVETRGHGFDDQGRPIILFEPHVFYRNLKGDARDAAVRQELAYPKWGEKPYPKDSYPRLRAACEIDETAALKSASWGLGQVLGENYAAAGFTTPQAMVQGMMDDEEVQLLAAVNFIKHEELEGHLRRHEWAAFALGYNGKGYKVNEYDTKLADAYRKWSRIADTPWPPAASPALQPAPPAPAQPVSAPAQPVSPPAAPVPPVAAPPTTAKTGVVQPTPKPRVEGSGLVASILGALALTAMAASGALHHLIAYIEGFFQ